MLDCQHFDCIYTKSGHKIVVQNGKLWFRVHTIAFWMGTPPSDKELEPRVTMQLDFSRAKTTSDFQLGDFEFSVQTDEGKNYVGKAWLNSLGHESFRGDKYTFFNEVPVVLEFEEV